MLFDQQDWHARAFELDGQLADLFDDQGRQAFGRLVEQQDLGARQHGARDGQHLLLAATQLIPVQRGTLPEARKARVGLLERPAARAMGRGFAGGDQQVLLNGQRAEDARGPAAPARRPAARSRTAADLPARRRGNECCLPEAPGSRRSHAWWSFCRLRCGPAARPPHLRPHPARRRAGCGFRRSRHARRGARARAALRRLDQTGRRVEAAARWP